MGRTEISGDKAEATFDEINAGHRCASTEITRRFQGMTAEPVHIGDDVWIGRGSLC